MTFKLKKALKHVLVQFTIVFASMQISFFISISQGIKALVPLGILIIAFFAEAWEAD